MNSYDVIIVGAGPAGMTAAIYAKRANLKVLMLEKLAPGGQIINTNEIQNYTGAGTINGADLAYDMYKHTMELSIEMEYFTVVEVRDENEWKRIICAEDNMEFLARAVILATGTKPKHLGISNEEQFAGVNLSWCAICDGPVYRNKDVAVIGGGNSAVEEALYLAGLAHSVTIITMFDLTADSVVCNKIKSLENVKIYPYQEVLEFMGEQRITGVRFQSTKTREETLIKCDGVFEYIGLTPVTEAFRNIGILQEQGYVKVNHRMETNKKGIYAIGDCIEKTLRQVITACADGAIAAQEVSRYIQSQV